MEVQYSCIIKIKIPTIRKNTTKWSKSEERPWLIPINIYSKKIKTIGLKQNSLSFPGFPWYPRGIRESAKLCGLRGCVGWLGHIFTWVAWVTWVKISFTWVINLTWVTWIKYIFAWAKIFCEGQFFYVVQQLLREFKVFARV